MQDNTSNQEASEVRLTSYPADLGPNPNPSKDVVYSLSGREWGQNIYNNFTVTNGQIVKIEFWEEGAAVLASNPSYLSINNNNGYYYYYMHFTHDYITGSGRKFNGVTFTPVSAAVPFEFSPSQGIALGLPLFIGLRMLKKRRALKNSTRVHDLTSAR